MKNNGLIFMETGYNGDMHRSTPHASYVEAMRKILRIRCKTPWRIIRVTGQGSIFGEKTEVLAEGKGF